MSDRERLPPAEAAAPRGAARGKFGSAFTGLVDAFRRERSLWAHAFCAVGVVIGGLCFRLSALEFSILALTIGLVMVLELANTALEHAVRAAVKGYDPVAGRALDVMAGAVLFAACASVAVALLIFGPRFWTLFGLPTLGG
ncbi:MAG: diacylglycerol kinase family protein [Planctomycetes bacterium]|nr:diacylglycerol kinase family protein [Planctomycetota bacterium]